MTEYGVERKGGKTRTSHRRLQPVEDRPGHTTHLRTHGVGVAAFVLRWRQPDAPRPYRAFGWPVTPILFLGLSLWMIVQGVRLRPEECGLYGALTLGTGMALYLGWSRFGSRGDNGH